MKLQGDKETDFNRIGRDGHTGYTNNSRSVQLVCLYLFEYQDAYQMNTNIRIIRIYSNNGIRMRPLPKMPTLDPKQVHLTLEQVQAISNIFPSQRAQKVGPGDPVSSISCYFLWIFSTFQCIWVQKCLFCTENRSIWTIKYVQAISKIFPSRRTQKVGRVKNQKNRTSANLNQNFDFPNLSIGIEIVIKYF